MHPHENSLMTLVSLVCSIKTHLLPREGMGGGEGRGGALPKEGGATDDYKIGAEGGRRSGGARGGGLDPKAPVRGRAEPPRRGASGEDEILAA
jgi:hypothetical protein